MVTIKDCVHYRRYVSDSPEPIWWLIHDGTTKKSLCRGRGVETKWHVFYANTRAECEAEAVRLGLGDDQPLTLDVEELANG